MDRFKSLFPDALAGRIVLLFATAIILANLVALAVLNFQQQIFDQQASEDREIERISTLMPAMEAVDAQARQVIARDASTRVARVRVEDAPLLNVTGADSRSRYIAQGLAEMLGHDDVTVAIIERPAPSDAAERPGGFRTDRVIAITIPLTARNGQAEWLNVVTSGESPRVGRVRSKLWLQGAVTAPHGSRKRVPEKCAKRRGHSTRCRPKSRNSTRNVCGWSLPLAMICARL